jgi:regulation of enolase protein 1 (concanavalin A-like superfamily)
MNATRIAKSRVMPALTLAACVLLAAMPAASQPMQTIKGWGDATDPDGDCKVSADGGKLTIWIPGSYHDFWAEKDKGKVNAPRVLLDADGDFKVQVKVTGPIKPEKGSMFPKLASGGPFQAGSLLIWQDRDNFIRLDRCCVYSPKERNIAFFYLQSFKDGKRAIDKDSNKVIDITAGGALDQDALLRLERKQGKVYPAFSQDNGATWQFLPLRSITTDLPGKVKVGVGAVNNTIKAFTVGFEDFQLAKVP